MGYLIQLFMALFITSSIRANEKPKTVPFFVKEYEVVSAAELEMPYSLGQVNGKKVVVKKKDKLVDIPTDEVKNFISGLQDWVCLGKVSQVKVWLKGEASGKVLGIGTSAESGVEITISCKN